MIVDEAMYLTIIKSLDERINAINEAEKKYFEENSKENFNDYLMNFFEEKNNLFDWEREILPKLNENFPNIMRLIYQNLCVDEEILDKFKTLSLYEKKILIKNIEVSTRVMKTNNEINKKSKTNHIEENKVFQSFEEAIKILNDNL